MAAVATPEVTKDFDAERVAGQKKPTTFSIGGEKFTVREFVSADVLADFGRREVANFADATEAYDNLVKECVVAGDGAKWDKVRSYKPEKESDPPPLTVGQIESIIWWLVDVVADRPTEASSSSRRGRGAPAAT